jgi:hypothetical protein
MMAGSGARLDTHAPVAVYHGTQSLPGGLVNGWVQEEVKGKHHLPGT